MGLFDFLKHGEHKTYNDTVAEKELKQAVEALNLGIKDLQVSYKDGLATISGVAPTQKDLEIARLTVGNHEGVHKVNDDGLTVAPQQQAAAAPEQQPGRMYTVKSGDTLSKIAKEELGDANQYPLLFEANKPMLKDPNKIYPGQVLRVPTMQPAHA